MEKKVDICSSCGNKYCSSCGSKIQGEIDVPKTLLKWILGPLILLLFVIIVGIFA